MAYWRWKERSALRLVGWNCNVKERWTIDHVPNQSGKTALVTGANSGLGLSIAAALAARGTTVVLGVRDQARGDAAKRRIEKVVSAANISVQTLDLASLASIRKGAAAISREVRSLDLLVNNAGVMWTPETTTEDGYELQFATNHLGHFLLTGLLLDVLANADAARVVTVASNAHKSGQLDFDNLNGERHYDRRAAYAQSKLANVMFTFELDRRLAESGHNVRALAAHPGGSRTALTRNSPPHMRLANAVLGPLLTQDPDRGALPALRAALDPDARGSDYFGPSGFREMRGHPRLVRTHPDTHDHAVRSRLWSESEKMTRFNYPI